MTEWPNRATKAVGQYQTTVGQQLKVESKKEKRIATITTMKQIIVENFPKLAQDNKSQIQEIQRTLSWREKNHAGTSWSNC